MESRTIITPIIIGVVLAAVVTAFLKNPKYLHKDTEPLENINKECDADMKRRVEGNLLCKEFVEYQNSIYRDGVTYSSKTSYRFTEHIEDESTLNGCTVIQIYAVYRHGARAPGIKHVKEFNDLHESICKMDAHVSKEGELLKNWVNPFPLDLASQLTTVGMKESYCLAERFQKRFPTLFCQKYSQQNYSIRSTDLDRTVQSALSFSQHLFEGTGPLNGYQPIALDVDSKTNDSLLRFFDLCPLYDKKTLQNETLLKFIDRFLVGPEVQNVLKNVQRKIDPARTSWNITTNQLAVMYRICAIEKANFGHSLWCNLFTTGDQEVFEYQYDLKSFWLKGYGNALNWNVSCPLITDIINNLNSAAKVDEQKGYEDMEEPPKVVLRFAHAETLIPLVCALGLYRDKEPLLPSNYESQKKRLFRVADLSPFAGNVAFVVYRCQSDEKQPNYQVRVLVNERAVGLQHPMCQDSGTLFCPLDKLPKIIHDITEGKIKYPCYLNEFCSTTL